KVPLPALRVEVPSVAAPSKKVTVPVGVPDPDGVTVAVKVTDCPNTEGLTDEVTDVVVPCLPMAATEKLACSVFQEPALLLLIHSFSAQNVVVFVGSTPMPL